MIDLFAISYGTRLAQTYMSLFPDRVRRVALDGVVPTSTLIALEAARHIDDAVTGLLDRCQREARCDARARGILDSIRATPDDSENRWRFAYAVRGALYASAALVPQLLTDAASGRGQLIDSMYTARAAWVGNATGTGLYLGINCAEDILHIDSAAVHRQTTGTLMGAMFYRQHLDGCRIWGVPRRDRPTALPRQSRTIALFMSGELDPVTPPSYAELVAISFDKRRHVIFAGGGHAQPSPCKARLLADFFDGLALASLAQEC